ncbi:hypothetical protein KJ819_03790 [Patescibacteria group bacterium]|nr:hypothetical protein [Patescibacteria group bacterium]MBU1500481.1 hypothetical protein [Patescibacteria group bacterium]MBU2080721.1 hypothetical protein [Patescibacteria group bacterium]MBU2123826.1 hypothetical protein [Patescibacteria group bacterium]MBU2194883.1 hypothetical protein [Patescibacteria group bacterium]
MKVLGISLLFLSLLLWTQSSVLAAGLPAGFAPGPIWVSKQSPSEGERIELYAAVYNSSDTSIEGSITFLVDDAEIGSVPFSLNDGETSIKSVEWVAVVGAHKIRAFVDTAIERNSKQKANIEHAEVANISIHVAEKEPEPKVLTTLDTAGSALTSVIASSSPLTSSITQSVVQTTESIRTAGESFLSGIAGTSTPASSRSSGEVLGAETFVAEPEEESSPGFIARIAETLLPIFRYPAIFYPVFLILLGAVFWILAGRLRNPGRRRRR